ncbi:MAG: PAS domain S-box protein [Gammaproteobacteria bacterium]|jgi:diguanylate cyclase (GGDEF)-like protein/PAS domain S-box-containing protein
MSAIEPKSSSTNGDGVAETALLAELAEHLDGAGLIVDQTLKVLHANEKACGLLDLPLTAVVGESLDSMIWRESNGAINTIGPRLKAAIRQGESLVLEGVCFTTADSTLSRHLNLRAVPLKQARECAATLIKLDGDPARYPERDEHRHLGVALGRTGSGVWEWEPLTGRFREFRGGPDGSFVSEGGTLAMLLNRLHQAERDEAATALHRYADGVGKHFSLRCRCAEPLIADAAILIEGTHKYRNAHGRIDLVCGTYSDVTELAQTESRLRQKTTDLSTALETARQGLWEWDAINNRFLPSASWCELFGYSAEQGQERFRDLAELAHPDELDSTRAALIAVMKGEAEVYSAEQSVRHESGRYLYCLIRGRVTERDRDGRAVRLVGTHTDITELKEARDAFTEKNRQLETVLENSRHGVWEWIPQTDEFSEFGYLRFASGLGEGTRITSARQLEALTHPDDIAKNRAAMTAYLSGAAAGYSIEHRVRNSDGTYRTFLVRGEICQRDTRGSATRVRGTLTDISDTKVAHQRLELALENGRQGMWEWRPVTDAVDFSDSWYALYGYEPGEIKTLRQDVKALIHPDDLPQARDALIRMLTGKSSDCMMEYRFRSKNGQYIWVMERSTVIERDSNGRATLVVGTHVDISTQKMVEQELAESQRFLKLVIDTIPDRVYWKDTRGRYLGVNRRFEIESGVTCAEEIIGKTDADLPWASLAPSIQVEDRQVVSSGQALLNLEHSFNDAHGVRHTTETVKIPLFHDCGVTMGVLGISQEVTQKRLHEKQMKKLAECITADNEGRLLDALAKGAVELSGISGAMVAKLSPDGSVATVVSTYPPNTDINGFAYDVVDTPCESAADCDLCVYPDNVQQVFPRDRPLHDLGIVGYAGKRLLDSKGQPIGIFALLDSKPMEDPDYAMSVLDILSATAAAELGREQREVALRESEKRYRTIYDNVPVVICTVDAEHNIIDVNNEWITTTGYGVDETVGTNLRDYLTPEAELLYLALPHTSPRTQRIADIKLDFRCKEGHTITLSYSATRTVSSDGRPVTVTVFEDLTNKIATEQELKLAATAFETHEALLIRDANKRILRVNSAFKNLTGYCDEDVVGKSPTDPGNPYDAVFDQSGVWRRVDLTGMWEGERLNARADGTTFSAWQTVTAVGDADGDTTHYVENFTDISELKHALADAERLAFYDPLTELPNRRYLAEELAQNIETSRRNGTTGALLFVDLDQFKNINDSLGHAVGDALLVQVAGRLSGLMRGEDTIARLGGDEFVIVLSELGSNPVKCRELTAQVAEKIRGKLGKPYEVENHEFTITPTIGITLFPEEGQTVDVILREADSAMYQGKADGRNVAKFYHPAMQTEAQSRLNLERDLRTAIERDQLELYYQPQYDRRGCVFAAEALLRWNHPENGLVAPGTFIPIAEESGLILDISKWVIVNALKSLRRWIADDTMLIDHLALNVSSRQFRSPDFVSDFVRDLVTAGVPTEKVVLEVTEGTVIENVDETTRKMAELRDIGVRFSVDDFGIGYSSLSYLSRLPLDQLKIDRSFVTNVLNDVNNAVIAETIIGMGRSLGLQTIAEGVESAAQFNFLKDKGCEGFQGYLFCRPIPEAEFLALGALATDSSPAPESLK